MCENGLMRDPTGHIPIDSEWAASRRATYTMASCACVNERACACFGEHSCKTSHDNFSWLGTGGVDIDAHNLPPVLRFSSHMQHNALQYSVAWHRSIAVIIAHVTQWPHCWIYRRTCGHSCCAAPRCTMYSHWRTRVARCTSSSHRPNSARAARHKRHPMTVHQERPRARAHFGHT